MQLDLFEKNLIEEFKATKAWMNRIEKKMHRLEVSFEALNELKRMKKQKTAVIEQLQMWGT